MFHRSGLVRPYVPPVRSGPGPGGVRADAFSRSSLMPEMVNPYRRWLDDQRLIVASMLSRRCTQAISDSACGTGMHRISRGARIHRNNRRGPYVSAAGVVPVTTVELRRYVLLDRLLGAVVLEEAADQRPKLGSALKQDQVPAAPHRVQRCPRHHGGDDPVIHQRRDGVVVADDD